jgi:hypothetical protein
MPLRAIRRAARPNGFAEVDEAVRSIQAGPVMLGPADHFIRSRAAFTHASVTSSANWIWVLAVSLIQST